MGLRIAPAAVADPGVASLLAAHAAHCSAASPAESCHFLPAAALEAPDITLWAARDGDQVLGVGALKVLSDASGEVKSMHTAAAARGRGVGAAILTTIETEALRRAYRALWLETGTMVQFAPARALYERHGYATCPPFGDYRLDPYSVYYTKSLTPTEAPR